MGTLGRGSVRTTGTVRTVERGEVDLRGPSYLSSPLEQMYTPLPRTPSPRRRQFGQRERDVEIRDMADSPKSFARHPRHPREKELEMETGEGGKGGGRQAGSEVETEARRSFATESEVGSVVRYET